jgi:hypothetical protein
MSDVVSQLINFIQAGDVSSAQSVCDDNSISVTHLMLASRNFVDPAQLAKQITAAPTNAQQVVEQPQQAQEEPVDLPFEPDVKPAQQPASAPARRRRAPSASIETKQITLSEAVSESTESPLGAEQQVPLPSYDKLNAVFERLEKLAGVCDEVLGRQVALDEGVGKDFGQVLESLASIRELVTTTHAEVMTNRKLILDALQAVFKFRAGTEALEIALIGKGLLDSAPFAESWNNG